MEPGNSGRRRGIARLPVRGNKRGNRPEQAQARRLGTKAGTTALLRKRLRAGGLYREKRRPRYWRSLAPALAGSSRVPEYRLNGWLLVLAARKIPHAYSPAGDRPRLYVPAVYERMALHEITAFEREKSVPVFAPPVRDNMPGVALFLLLLLLWHLFRWGWFGSDALPRSVPDTPQAWAAAYGLDVYRTRIWHEWWRAITALTLHADANHIFSNLGFGLLFLGMLCRRAGLGLGIALAVLAGVLGNVCNALTREAHVISTGFSTSLFGALGSLCALRAVDIFRHNMRFSRAVGPALFLGLARELLVPLAAGLALLGFLGGGAEARTDYPAHIWGFCCGIVVAVTALGCEKKLFALAEEKQTLMQGALFCAVIALFAGTWLHVL